jgi:hypothetical protein
MSDLEKVLCSVLASVTHARRIADEETVAIAEYYKSTDLLRGMSLPRVRMPEIEVDLPVLVESFDEGRETPAPSPAKVKERVRDQLEALCREVKVPLPKSFLGRFASELGRRLKDLGDEPLSAANLVEAADAAFRRAREGDPLKERFTREQEMAVREALRQRVRKEVHKEPPLHPSRFDVSVVTGDIKERGGPANVARLKISLHEEGLEWTRIEQPDGTVRDILVPE